jgi:glycosyltransferase involved in cell wall biosynthesis
MEKLGHSFEIIVVDDGSSDETLFEARKIAGEMPAVKVVSLALNHGKGWALKEGFGISRGDLIIFLDGDLDIQPRQIGIFLDIMEKDKADVVIGSKRHPLSKLNYPFGRKFLSSVYFFLVKILFGLPIHDTQTGLKLFKRKVLEDIFPRILVKRYAFDLELLVNAFHHGYSIREAPVVVDFNRFLGHIGMRSIWETWWDTMAVFYRLYILRYYDRKGIDCHPTL